MAKLRLLPVLRLDSGADLDTRVRILRMITQLTAFYSIKVAIRESEKTRKRTESLD